MRSAQSSAASERAARASLPGMPGGQRSHDNYYSDFRVALRYWRDRRGYSQLRLSTESDISQRHISYIECGRAQPSRELILKLGRVLDIPLRQRNAMLLAAGYAPAYKERPLSDPELSSVRQALEFMLAQQAPYPALVVDRLWNLLMANQPAQRLMKWLLDMPASEPMPLDGQVNVIRMMLDPAALRPYLGNWEATCADVLQWVQREAMNEGPSSDASRLLQSLTALPGVATALSAPNLESRKLPFLPVQLTKQDLHLNLFTTIATLGTPHDVTVHELRIESFFPADDATAEWFRQL